MATRRARVLDMIEQRGPMGLDDLARLMGERPRDVAPVVDDLVAAGVLRRDGGAVRYVDYRPVLHKAVQAVPDRRVANWRGDAVAAVLREWAERDE